VGSPVPARNQNRPTAKKLSSFLWKTRDERTTEVTGSPSEYPHSPLKAPPPANLSLGCTLASPRIMFVCLCASCVVVCRCVSCKICGGGLLTLHPFSWSIARGDQPGPGGAEHGSGGKEEALGHDQDAAHVAPVRQREACRQYGVPSLISSYRAVFSFAHSLRFSSLSSLPTAQAAKRHEFGVTIEELASRENAIRGIPYVVFVLITHMAEHCMRLLPPTCSVASCAVDETLTLPPTHSAGPGGSVPNLSGVPRSLGDEGDA
jgi:hypothetical protein